jgi:hypothetical protein
MPTGGDGRPECSCEQNKLGATPRDVQPNTNGEVGPVAQGGRPQGMSVTTTPERLPSPLRPERFPGGSGRLPLYRIDLAGLGADLALHPARPRGHAYVEPTRVMHIVDYQAALWGTRDSWQEVP